ncbi:MAG: hypothetical protein M1834_009118 [Cirrosporium novae-zelandiae]|nr:MAG: hypothetical protein M1834_009118 [Cirrosporium novae-zelandiae]
MSIEDDGGLLAIEIDDEPNDHDHEKERGFQSEEDFNKVKESYQPLIENGKIWKSLEYPLKVSGKHQEQRILHAIEQLYFARKYPEALNVLDHAMSSEGVHKDYYNILHSYKSRIITKQEKEITGRQQLGIIDENSKGS